MTHHSAQHAQVPLLATLNNAVAPLDLSRLYPPPATSQPPPPQASTSDLQQLARALLLAQQPPQQQQQRPPALDAALSSDAASLLARCLTPQDGSGGALAAIAPLATRVAPAAATVATAATVGTNSADSQIDDLTASEIQVLQALHALSSTPVDAAVAPAAAAPAVAAGGEGAAEAAGAVATAAGATSPLAHTDSCSPLSLSAAVAVARGNSAAVSNVDTHGAAARRASHSQSEASHDTPTRAAALPTGTPSGANARGEPDWLLRPAPAQRPPSAPRPAAAASPTKKRSRLSSDAILAWGLSAARAAAAGLPEPPLPEGVDDLAQDGSAQKQHAVAQQALSVEDVPSTGPFAMLRTSWGGQRDGGGGAAASAPARASAPPAQPLHRSRSAAVPLHERRWSEQAAPRPPVAAPASLLASLSDSPAQPSTQTGFGSPVWPLRSVGAADASQASLASALRLGGLGALAPPPPQATQLDVTRAILTLLQHTLRQPQAAAPPASSAAPPPAPAGVEIGSNTSRELLEALLRHSSGAPAPARPQ